MVIMRRPALLVGLALLVLPRGGSAQLPSTNPFAAPSPLLYQAPDFTRIRAEHFQPAIEEGMRQQLAEVAAVLHDPAPPTFENTILPLERAGQLLSRAQRVFGALTSANTNDTLQAIQRALAPRLAAHRDAIALNDTLFQRIRSLYDRRASLGLDSLQRLVVERYYRDFVRSGALLSEADKTRVRELNREAAQLGNQFGRQLLAATRAGGVHVVDSADLAGLSAGEIGAARSAARARGLPGWLLPLQNTTQQPAQAALVNRALRQRLFEASTLRASRGDSNDTRTIIPRLAQLRAERARLLGYPTFAAYGLEEQMARTPDAALGLLQRLAPPAVARAREEAAAMQRLVNRLPRAQRFPLEPWDWQYYAEQVRVAQYALDEEQIKPYFELNRVLEDGVFYAANRLYGLTFRERRDISVYQPDVRVFEVFDADTSLGLFYADYYKRDNKNGGAWSSGFVSRSSFFGTRPVVTNTCNFTKPAEGQPALLTWDNVTTMFHEFGHALSSFFNAAPYPRLAGNMPRDFIEVPSQFNEHWALEPEVFAHYARHYQTGAPMPAELVAKIRRTTTFDQGFATTEYLAAALLDLAWHTLPADQRVADVDAFEAEALRRFGVDVRLVPPRYRTPYFSHIWGGGYSAGYYAYIWSEVLDADAYAWFTENGGMTRQNGQRFRDLVLARGGTGDMATIYREFRGRDPDIGPLLRNRGLEAAAGTR